MYCLLASMLYPVLATSTPGSFSDILANATEVFTWFITSMGSLVTFVLAHPIVLMMFMILLSGSVIGMFMRLWKSA